MGFFKPRRRKFGMLTLVMALALLGGWVKSATTTDIFAARVSGTLIAVKSRDRKIGCGNCGAAPLAGYPFWTFYGNRLRDPHPLSFNSIPYWTLFLPLALFSTFLLSGKTAKKTLEPGPAGGTSMMGTFFHGWKRKLGVGTLLVACLSAVGWVRSMGVHDGIYIGRAKHQDSIVSFQAEIHWQREYKDFSTISPPSISWNSRWLPQTTLAASSPQFEWQWRWQHLGFGVRECHSPRNTGGTLRKELVIPYWSIMLPITLVSAYLLLSKPRQSNQVKLTDGPVWKTRPP